MGCQSLHTNGYDEAFAIPTEDAMRMALRTQQVIAEETNVTQVTDPVGGSYFLETLTTDYEKRIFEILDEVEKRGGTLKLIQDGWFQRHIADFAYETALRKQSGDKPVIGVNRFVDGQADPEIHVHPYDQTTAERQVNRTQRVRRERDAVKMEQLLQQLLTVAKDPSQNIMPITIELVKAGATMGGHHRDLAHHLGHLSRDPGILSGETMQQPRSKLKELKITARQGDRDAAVRLLAHSVSCGHERLSVRRYLVARGARRERPRAVQAALPDRSEQHDDRGTAGHRARRHTRDSQRKRRPRHDRRAAPICRPTHSSLR
ncbi:MAG: methylmalonyl-CoA mutase family protein [Hyphomicrobium sp.]